MLAMSKYPDPATFVSSFIRRPHQEEAYEAFKRFLTTLPEDVRKDPMHAFARIVQPPRTGKTALIGELVVEVAGRTLVLVHTQMLVDQAARELSRQLPALRVRAYHAGMKERRLWDVLVTTYSMAQRRFATGRLPDAWKQVSLVCADEAHHSMSKDRMAFLQNAFSPEVPRIALTATPDYSDERVLSACFPTLLHEMASEEADRLGLLAPCMAFVTMVDENTGALLRPRVGAKKSWRVHMTGDDFDPASLAHVLHDEHLFRACVELRYLDKDNATRPCLITCANQEQAKALQAFMALHKWTASPTPELVLHGTSGRKAALAAFEDGRADTLISVRILSEGWNSPRCSLLIDLAPTTSLVLAKQKYYRPRTPAEGKDARIFVILPSGLPRMPILPVDVFGWSIRHGDIADTLLVPPRSGPTWAAGGARPRNHRQVGTRNVFVYDSKRPAFNPNVAEHLERMAEWIVKDGRVATFYSFRRMEIRTPLFIGSGEQLLRHSGFPANRTGYMAFLRRLNPDLAGTAWLKDDVGGTEWCADDLGYLESVDADECKPGVRQALHDAIVCLRGGEPFIPPDSTNSERKRAFDRVLTSLTPREEKVIRLRYGLGDAYDDDLDLEAIGLHFEVKGERARQIESKALRKLRHPYRAKRLRPFMEASVADELVVLLPETWREMARDYHKECLEAIQISLLNQLSPRRREWLAVDEAGTIVLCRDKTEAMARVRRDANGQPGKSDFGYWNCMVRKGIVLKVCRWGYDQAEAACKELALELLTKMLPDQGSSFEAYLRGERFLPPGVIERLSKDVDPNYGWQYLIDDYRDALRHVGGRR